MPIAAAAVASPFSPSRRVILIAFPSVGQAFVWSQAGGVARLGPLILLMCARVAHHFQADEKLYIARRAANRYGTNALRALGRRYFCPLLLQTLAAPSFPRHAALDRAALAARRQGDGGAAGAADFIPWNRVGHLDDQ